MQKTTQVCKRLNRFADQLCYGECYKLDVCISSKFVCWNLISHVVVFGDGDFGKWLGHERRALMNRIGVLMKETPKSSLILLPCEDTMKRWPSMNQEMGSHQALNLGALTLCFPAFKTIKINFYWLRVTRSMLFCYSTMSGLKPSI